ncbi:MAG: SusD/RagB family nutrient-binding outer membrane lipoprotein, partial [Pedobacter sp.]
MQDFNLNRSSKMKNYSKYILVFGLLVVGAGACKKEDFVEANTDPRTLYSIQPKEQFLNAIVKIHGTDFEWYYDNYRRIMPWMQYLTPQNGNAVSFLQDIGNFNQRYGVFFNNVGNALEDVIEMIEASPDAASMEYMKQIAIIVQAQYAFYVSEINGSIPYSQAFRARYENLLKPQYDTQEQLFTLVDQEVKNAITVLKTPQSVTQESYGTHDQYYKGN